MRMAILAMTLLAPSAFADVNEAPFGKLPDGREVKLFTLTNTNGMTAKIMTYGAILTELHVPDKDGTLADVVLGFDSLDGYLKDHPYFGSNVGRCANRIANGKFTLDGKEYTLATNNGKHHLHGGAQGFNKKLWTAEPVAGKNAVTFSYTSPDGEEGYPGTLKVTATYTLTDTNGLEVSYTATTDKSTVCNLAHHSYFNLAGHNSGDILKHVLTLNADNCTPTDDTLITTGKIEPVEGTPYDFRKPQEIGAKLRDIKSDPVGYDVNFVVNPGTAPLTVATVVEPGSGREMVVKSSGYPGVQFYSGNFLDGTNVGKGGAVYKQYNGFCFEPQTFPDAVNKLGVAGWDAPILKPGETYKKTALYQFNVAK